MAYPATPSERKITATKLARRITFAFSRCPGAMKQGDRKHAKRACGGRLRGVVRCHWSLCHEEQARVDVALQRRAVPSSRIRNPPGLSGLLVSQRTLTFR